MSLRETIAANRDRLLDSIRTAAERSGRDAHDVTLVAVTKYAELDWVRSLYDLGHRQFGESRPQQLTDRVAQLPTDIEWHMIGHLQRNKVRPVLTTGAVIHSVDSERLLARVDLLAGELDVLPDLFLEVNVSGEASKDGFPPGDLLALAQDFARFPHVRIRGLMTMAPAADDPAAARPVFRELRTLRDQLRGRPGLPDEFGDLSMGMSGDFEIAIEEGATHVRIGSALFEGLSA